MPSSLSIPLASPYGGTMALPPPPIRAAARRAAPAAGGVSGTDISAIPDLDPLFTLITDPNKVLGEALVRRLWTRRGSLFYSPKYGKDIRSYLNASFDPKTLRRLEQDVARELEQDPRVKSVRCAASTDSAAQSISLTIAVVAADGPFKLTLAVTSLDVAMLRVEV